MALNFSHRPIFPVHLSEDNLVSPMSGFFVDGVSDWSSDVYGMSRLINRELVDCLDFLEDNCEGGASRDCVSGDVLDLLPSDPFGMDISTTFTAITGWLDDLNVDCGSGGYGRDGRVPVDEDYQLFAGLNYIWNNAFRFEAGNEGFFHSFGELEGFSEWSDWRNIGALSYHTDPQSSYDVHTNQNLGIEHEISRGVFGAWSDKRNVGSFSCLTDPQSPYVVDTIQSFGIEPEISGGGFATWSNVRIAGSVACHTDTESPYAVDTIQTLGNEPEIFVGGFGVWYDGRKTGGVSCFSDPKPPPYVVDTIQTFGIEPETSGVQPVVIQEGSCVSSDVGEPPHAALNLVLGYLGTRELLVVESVCRSLQSTAEGDPFFWRNINICGKLDVKITDDVLLKLTSKAQGGLESLSLVNCIMISDDGLNEVLLNNPKVTKLCVPGCTRLTIGGIVDNLKAFKSRGRPGLKHLSIAGMYGVTEVHFKELEQLLLGTDNLTQQNTHRPRFYQGGIHIPSCNDGRAIDIERCPKCMNMRIVYDCPVVGCKGLKEGDTNPNANTQRCRGCTLCIARCNWCGRCIDETVHEETFCLDLRCIDCGKQISKCESVGGGWRAGFFHPYRRELQLLASRKKFEQQPMIGGLMDWI